MRVKEWPNGLGFDLATNSGEWEFLGPHPGSSDPWQARYIPRGSYYGTLIGKGTTPTLAFSKAIGERVPPLSECRTFDDVLAAAAKYETATPMRHALA